ncbi:hypothetical protein GUITHDRAFT_106130 [Guillardia theta CCMP2712]|uniref:Saposin A-type domain-containing protein n=1 Tax=Guillardia theta (strain CCMP2712) TaxID=905079 RepID=L1JIR9_GUITC|nr:hypothetical protein GUITHDRAFT_106130 [Guillardia theta CCMP2712]EKX48049.1 hypothetical protein GUITHDRAFT_106130 [Guillardia theta CCMP2712]|eukprot:XP_005835029.1 hypothetical protein GUITHDRAFT_106130 [Guillardia theta CCMP2712]
MGGECGEWEWHRLRAEDQAHRTKKQAVLRYSVLFIAAAAAICGFLLLTSSSGTSADGSVHGAQLLSSRVPCQGSSCKQMSLSRAKLHKLPRSARTVVKGKSMLSSVREDEKVKVRLYMESQCPACKKYSTTYIKQLLETPGVKDIVDFKFVPWGNGKILNNQQVLNTTQLLSSTLNHLELAVQSQNSIVDSLVHDFNNMWRSLSFEITHLKQNPIVKKYTSLAHFSTREKAVKQSLFSEEEWLANQTQFNMEDWISDHTLPGIDEWLANQTSFDFEAWLSSQPTYDIESWLSGGSGAAGNASNSTDSRSDIQKWLDDQPDFDFEAWLAAQPVFDFDGWLSNVSKAQQDTSSNSSGSGLLSEGSIVSLQAKLDKLTSKLMLLKKACLGSRIRALRTSALHKRQALAEESSHSINLNLVFLCQHGSQECAGNAWENCIQSMYPDQQTFFPVIDCVEKRGCAEGQKAPEDCEGEPQAVAGGCVHEFGHGVMDINALQACVYGSQGRGLQIPESTILLLQAAKETSEATGRQWVPWLTIDGVSPATSQDDFGQIFLVGMHVCNAYAKKTGKTPPSQCSSFITQVPADPWAAFNGTSL